MGSMRFTVMAAFGQIDHEIKKERVVDWIDRRGDAGKDLGGQPRMITDAQIRDARRLGEGGEGTVRAALDLEMPGATLRGRVRALGLLRDQSADETLTSDAARQ